MFLLQQKYDLNVAIKKIGKAIVTIDEAFELACLINLNNQSQKQG